MILYRVGNIETNQGLWYTQQGVFHGDIHSKFKELSASALLMPFNPEVKGFLSCTKTLEELKAWFNEADLKILKPHEYYITEYESNDCFPHANHWLMYESAKVLRIFKDGYPDAL